MGQNIRILPENLCNKIAAGEVVERPASVVKELVENSIDAGATEVRIDVEQGGKKLIRVMDNGVGMSREDAFLCFERHATSKILKDDDLFNIRTLGFRGEAIPSIAAVSHFLLRTATSGAMEGWEIYLEGGVVHRAVPVGFAGGTVIEVRDLFFNMPARRKFLRRDETELGHIGDVVTKMALANPEVRFILHHNGRPLLEVPGHAELDDRIARIFGRTMLDGLLPISEQFESGLAIHGLISNPSVNRSSSANIYVFINGRFIRDRVVQHAIMEGYRSLIEKGRYPVSVLFIDIDPAQVDVNVHPTKQEVRFRDQKTVHAEISEAVRRTLRPSPWLLSSDFSSGSKVDVIDAGTNSVDTDSLQMPPTEPEFSKSDANYRQRVSEALVTYEYVNAKRDTARDRQYAFPENVCGNGDKAALYDEPTYFSSLLVIGQYRNTYIICQAGDDLVLIDQHAAHERIRFERLKHEFERGDVERQTLLFPSTIELDFREAALFEDYIEEFGQFGFELEHFGGKTYVLKTVPSILGNCEASGLLKDIAGELAISGASGLHQDTLEKVLSVIACHSAIRANRHLDLLEIESLLKELDTIDFNAHCPHGRPVLQKLTLSDIEKMFRRA